jgi:hypothetical protein
VFTPEVARTPKEALHLSATRTKRIRISVSITAYCESMQPIRHRPKVAVEKKMEINKTTFWL